MQGSLWRAKLKATGVSLGVWLVSAVVLTACAFYVLFPHFLFWVDGGLSLLRVMVLVDLVLGPVLMFIIFNPGKSRRMQIFDIVTVVVIQIFCFGYGLFLMYSQHPAFVSYYNNAFHPVRGFVLSAQDPSPDVMDKLTTGEPAFWFTVNPTKAQNPRALQLSMKQQIPLDAQVELQQPVEAHAAQVFAGSDLIEQFLKQKMPAELQKVSTANAAAGKLSFVWFAGRDTNAVLVFDSKASFLGAIGVPASDANPALLLTPAQPVAPQPMVKKRIDKSMDMMSLVKVPSET